MLINYPIQYQSSIKYAVCIFLDRIDIQCKITPVPFKDISKVEPGEPIAPTLKAQNVLRCSTSAKPSDTATWTVAIGLREDCKAMDGLTHNRD